MYQFLFLYIVLLSFGASLNFLLLGKQIQLADILFIFIFAKLIWDTVKMRRIALFVPQGIIRYLLVTLLTLLSISCIFSASPAKSISEFVAITYLIILYSWIAGIRLNQQRFELLLKIWLCLSAALCLLGLWGFMTYLFFNKNNLFVQNFPYMKSIIPFARISATFPTMNMFASYLHISIVFLLSIIAYSHWSFKKLALFVLIFICLFLTASRNLLGIFVTMFLFFMPVKNRLNISVLKYIAFGFVILLLFLVLITTVWCIFPIKTEYDIQNHSLTLSVNTAPSLYGLLNRMSLRLIRQKFLLGVGPGVFNQMFVKYVNWDEVKDTWKAKGITNRNISFDPHNTYLGWAAEAGLPFVLAMMGLFCAILHFTWEGYKRSVNSFEGIFCYACMCGVSGFMVNGFYVDILTMRHFWVMLGMATIAATSCMHKLNH